MVANDRFESLVSCRLNVLMKMRRKRQFNIRPEFCFERGLKKKFLQKRMFDAKVKSHDAQSSREPVVASKQQIHQWGQIEFLRGRILPRHDQWVAFYGKKIANLVELNLRRIGKILKSQNEQLPFIKMFQKADELKAI